MSDATSPVPRTSPSGGRVWLLPSSPFETVAAGADSAENSGEASTVLRPVFGPPAGGSPLPPPRSAAA